MRIPRKLKKKLKKQAGLKATVEDYKSLYYEPLSKEMWEEYFKVLEKERKERVRSGAKCLHDDLIEYIINSKHLTPDDCVQDM